MAASPPDRSNSVEYSVRRPQKIDLNGCGPAAQRALRLVRRGRVVHDYVQTTKGRFSKLDHRLNLRFLPYVCTEKRWAASGPIDLSNRFASSWLVDIVFNNGRAVASPPFRFGSARPIFACSCDNRDLATNLHIALRS
jgi:hypothetical protein